MDKREAAEVLGVSVRRVEELDRQRRLGWPKRYVRGKTGKQRDFEPEAVERLKVELEAEVVALEAPNRRAGDSTGLASPNITPQDFAAMIAEAMRPVMAQSRPADTRPMLMTRAEALEASGLPASVFALAVKHGAIRKSFRGHATRYSRDDALGLASREDLAHLVESWHEPSPEQTRNGGVRGKVQGVKAGK